MKPERVRETRKDIRSIFGVPSFMSPALAEQLEKHDLCK